MKKQNSSVQNVIDFFSRYTKDNLTKLTEINNDLQFIGDDADFMLTDFSKHFSIDLEEVDLSDFFVDELGIFYLYYKFFKPRKLIKPPLTIEHLAKVVEKGYWFYPIGAQDQKPEDK